MKKLTAIVLLILTLTLGAMSVSAAGLTLTAPEAGVLTSASQQVLVRGTAEAGERVTVYVNGSYAGYASAGKNGAYLLAVSLEEGANTLVVKAGEESVSRQVDFSLEAISVSTTDLTAEKAVVQEAEVGFLQRLILIIKNWFQ